LKYLLSILLLTVGICQGQEKKTAELKKYSAIGTINKKIPVELNFTVSNHIVSGEIRYLNTKSKLPIRILGHMDAENKYVLNEYGKDGVISGIINGKMNGRKLNGSWNPIKSRDSYILDLNLKDNSKVKQAVFEPATLEGNYAYQYGDKGYQGSIDIKKGNDNTYTYEIGSVTSGPARNQADASASGIVIKNNKFVIEINKSCKFNVTIYNGFLIIAASDQTQVGDCEFGFNATLEGTYLKIK